MQRTLLYFAAFTGMGAVFAATLLVAALVLGQTSPPGVATSASPQASAPAPVAEGPIGEIRITAFDLGFEPAMVDVAEPGTYTVTFVNDGGVLHDVTFADGTKISAEGHATATGEVTIPAEGMSFICSVPGHSDAGMTGEVMVGMVSASAEPTPSAGTMTAEQMRDVDAAVTAKFPAETEGQGNVILEPEIQADGTLQWELTASVIDWETEPGKVQQAYAYNGMVPGPQLRAEVGDRIRIILHNELPEPTTIHSHGLFVPTEMDGVPVISQPAVMPGESFTYEYTLRNAGSHMYHSHFMAEHQVPMGLLGAFVVTDPSADEAAADRDVTMILNDGPLGFTINGKGFPATTPLVAQRGEMIRIRYMNEGLQIHPMHLHGMPQLVIAKDGWTLPTPHYEDTVLVAPGERIDV
ncbi:MAG TPA: multicopper oxidase domain-containing protein, partial [Aeromicrobium sp.]|nr:multicopper oxidase domain-containing protein [Aeromicrobium sp.]